MKYGPEATKLFERLDVMYAKGLKDFKFSFERYSGWKVEDIARELNMMMDAYDAGYLTKLDFADSNRL